jgi:hypothetical protein
MKKTETSIKISWEPARLMATNTIKKKGEQESTWKTPGTQVDKYIATIFPGNELKEVNIGEPVEFSKLAGGTQEYTITVSAMINNAKMKGARTMFHLPPFPPQVRFE